MLRITVRKVKKKLRKKNNKKPVPSFNLGTGFLILLYWRLLHIQGMFHILQVGGNSLRIP